MDMKKTTGELSLLFRKKKNGQTYRAEQYYKLPLQVMRAHYQDSDGTAFIYLLNPSGGVLQHDRLLTEITLEEGSRVYVTTPSNTKFYKMDEGYARVDNVITVGRDAVLEYLPEHNAPFAMSEAYQENEFHLSGSSVLIASDMVSAGRATCGEKFDYRLYASRTRIYVDGKLKIYDCSHIKPDETDMERLGYMEGHLTNGTIYVYAERIEDALPERLNAMEAHGDVVFAAGKIDDSMMIVRFVGGDMVSLKETLNDIWGQIRRDVLGKEPVRIRKY